MAINSTFEIISDKMQATILTAVASAERQALITQDMMKGGIMVKEAGYNMSNAKDLKQAVTS